MDGLLGRITSRRSGPLPIEISLKGGLEGAAAADLLVGKRTPSYTGGLSPRISPRIADGDETTEVVRREDSETYAKRTISEIETCLGFRFQPGAVGGEESPAEVMDDSDIQQLNTQLEAALASGLSFKDKLRTDSAKKLLVPAANAANDVQASTAAAAREEPARGGAARPTALEAGKPKLGGAALKLAVGSQMQVGEWQSNGEWQKKDKKVEVPTNLPIIPPEDLVKVKELGRGCFGSVWLAKWRGVEVALKELLHAGSDTASQELFSEAERLASLRHPCVMSFYGIMTQEAGGATLAEYMCHGSLRSGLSKIRKKGINDKRLKAYIALQSAHGMEYLHRQYIVHFDLKGDNLLCDLRDLNKPVVKIGDLGLSKTKKGSFISGNMRGTLPWMAPELFPSLPAGVSGMSRKEPADRVTEKVDVFSFGIVLWEVWTLGEQPYPNLSLQEIFAGVMTGTLRPAIPTGCDPAWASLMQDCWQAVPRSRPSFTEIIARLEAMLRRWSQQVTAPLAAGSP